MKYLIYYGILVVMSLICFILMGVDKHRAIKHLWRIPEKTLFLFAILLGGTGGTAGMYLFHHKTKHWYFHLFFPLFAVIELLAPLALHIWLSK